MAVEFWNSLVTAKPIFPPQPHIWKVKPASPLALPFAVQKGGQDHVLCWGVAAGSSGLTLLWPASAPLSSRGAASPWLTCCETGARSCCSPLPSGAEEDDAASRNELDLSGYWKRAGCHMRSELDFFIWPVPAQKSPLAAVRAFSLCWHLFLYGCLSTNPVFITCLKWCPISFSVL